MNLVEIGVYDGETFRSESNEWKQCLNILLKTEQENPWVLQGGFTLHL